LAGTGFAPSNRRRCLPPRGFGGRNPGSARRPHEPRPPGRLAAP